MLHNWTECASQGKWLTTQIILQDPRVSQGKGMRDSSSGKSVIWSQHNRAFQLLNNKLKTDRPTNKHQLKAAALKASQGRKCSIWWCSWILDFSRPLTVNDFHHHFHEKQSLFKLLMLNSEKVIKTASDLKSGCTDRSLFIMHWTCFKVLVQ